MEIQRKVQGSHKSMLYHSSKEFVVNSTSSKAESTVNVISIFSCHCGIYFFTLLTKAIHIETMFFIVSTIK